MPITYTWEATGQAAVIHGSVDSLTDSANFAWPSAGPQAITVTAANLSDAVTGVYTITVVPATYTITAGSPPGKAAGCPA